MMVSRKAERLRDDGQYLHSRRNLKKFFSFEEVNGGLSVFQGGK